jgi:pyridoxal phosphate enzyme (YggS family)
MNDDHPDIVRATQHVRAVIADACSRAGRDPAAVTLVAVSKTVPADRLRDAVRAAGLDRLGENRVQEAADKVAEVPDVTWELVGPLQSNKARRAVELFGRIQSVDSVALARRLDRIAGELRPDDPLPVLLQVNVDDDPSKAGFDPMTAAAALGELLDLPHLRVEGLMTIGRQVDGAAAARPTFQGLRELGERLRTTDPRLGSALSMGMTDDYPVAIEEGATIVRVGRAIFGERHPHDGGAHTH